MLLPSITGGEKHIYHHPRQVEDDLRGELAARLGKVDCLSENLYSLSDKGRQQQEQLVISREEKIETIRQSASDQVSISICPSIPRALSQLSSVKQLYYRPMNRFH